MHDAAAYGNKMYKQRFLIWVKSIPADGINKKISAISTTHLHFCFF